MRIVALLALTAAISPAAAERRASARPAPVLAALAPAEDARGALAIGPGGQVYAPDGKGAWIRTTAFSTADRIAHAGRAGTAVVAYGEGVVYRLAPNGWSAQRLTQKGKAVMSRGPRAVAAVGRQLFALDRTVGGEPARLALAPSPVLALGTGASAIVIATERGLFRRTTGAFSPIKRVPRRVERLIADRWALLDRGAVDLKTAKKVSWPDGLRVEIATLGPRDVLVGVGKTRTGIELVTVQGTKVTREPIAPPGAGVAGGGVPVDLVVDRSGRAVIAFADGRLLVRDRGIWTQVTVSEALPAPRPGAPPATSP